MDIFNKKKVAELEAEISLLNEDLNKYKQIIEEQNEGKHKIGEWCVGCGHSVLHAQPGYFPKRFCMLDNPCKDRIGGISSEHNI